MEAERLVDGGWDSGNSVIRLHLSIRVTRSCELDKIEWTVGKWNKIGGMAGGRQAREEDPPTYASSP